MVGDQLTGLGSVALTPCVGDDRRHEFCASPRPVDVDESHPTGALAVGDDQPGHLVVSHGPLLVVGTHSSLTAGSGRAETLPAVPVDEQFLQEGNVLVLDGPQSHSLALEVRDARHVRPVRLEELRGGGPQRSRTRRRRYIGRGTTAPVSDPDPGPAAESGGKADRELFESVIRPHLGADRADVSVGPAHGVDFGVVTVGDHVLVTATDPISVLPALGWERAGRFAMSIVLADVAVSGLPPTHVAVGLHLPTDLGTDALRRTWRGMSDAAEEVGAAVVTGHTGRYAGCSLPWVGAATAMAVGDPDHLVRPDGARPGDRLIVAESPAVETTALLAALFPDRVTAATDRETTERARALIERTSPVEAALVAAAAGPVTAMHDVTERGLANALHETSEAAGVALEVERAAVPIDATVERVCSSLDLDPWTTASAGTLLVAVRPDGVDAVIDAVAAEDIPVAQVGRVTEGSGVTVDGVSLDRPDRDGFADLYGSLRG